MTPEEALAFIATNTARGTHLLVPEIHLHLASEITPIWQASEEALEERGIEPPFWAFAWPGGVATARYLLDHPDACAGKRVLDMAAGCGIGGIAAALSGAALVEAADIDAMALAAVKLNATENNVDIKIIEGDLLAAPPPETDLILAGDVFYERALARILLPWLQIAATRGQEVLIADPGRAYLPECGLEAVARMDVPTTRELEAQDIRETVIYRLVGG